MDAPLHNAVVRLLEYLTDNVRMTPELRKIMAKVREGMANEHKHNITQPSLTVGAVLNAKNLPKERQTRWIGSDPKECDTCHGPLVGTFADCKTTMGPWGLLCMTCVPIYGAGIGQVYEQQRSNGDWVKVRSLNADLIP